MKVLSLFLSSWLLFFSCKPKDRSEAKVCDPSAWSYRGDSSPSEWHTLSTKYEMCQKGHKQSPINIGSDTIRKHHDVVINYKSSHEYIINNGHTVEMLYDNGSSIEFDHKIYDLVQFHFHTPSEHHIKDSAYLAEMHLVHRSPEGEHLVMAVLINNGRFNKTIQQIIDNAPKFKGENEKMDQINIATILPENPHYYFYEGSFTTPPCTENVKWLIHRKHIEISNAQLSELLSKEGFNARPIQKKYHRKVEVF